MDDMDVLDFARKISMLPIDTTEANRYEKEYGQKDGRWWTCQREHITVWCLHQPTNGVKGFTHKPNNSARKMYYHMGRSEMYLWLAQAVGIPPQQIEEAISNIVNCSRNESLKYLRQAFPFERIICKLRKIA